MDTRRLYRNGADTVDYIVINRK